MCATVKPRRAISAAKRGSVPARWSIATFTGYFGNIFIAGRVTQTPARIVRFVRQPETLFLDQAWHLLSIENPVVAALFQVRSTG